jgi:Lrp/AsnC family transcriptional regulator
MIDDTDRAILRRLQEDASQSLESIADALSLSVNTCWRRIKKLEQEGVISRRVAILDGAAFGLSQTVFVAIRTNDHSPGWLERFTAKVKAIPEVVEFYRMAGETDYLLKIIVGSVAEYDRVYRRLISEIEIADVSASFAMECLKQDTRLPI